MQNMIDLRYVAEELPTRFYSNTLPPHVAWSFVLVHLEDFDIRLRQYGNFAKHIILDINVHRFRHYGDYPIGELVKYGRVVKKLAEKYRDRICFVLLDLPHDSDYFRGARYCDNIRKTYTYHTAFLKYVSDICYRTGSQMILVVQHRAFRDEKGSIDVAGRLSSIRRSCEYVNDLLSYVRQDIVYAIAIGSLCVVKTSKIIADFTLEVARRFPKLRVHGLGYSLATLDHLHTILHRFSYDSTGWTRPVCNRVLQLIGSTKRYSCKTPKERVIYFLAYVARLCEKLRKFNLAQELWTMAEKYAAKTKVREVRH